MLRKYRHGPLFYLRSRWILDRNITSIGTSKQNTLHPDFRKFDEIRILIMHRLPTITTSFSTFSCLNSEGKIYLKIFPLVLFLLWRSKGNILFWIAGLFVSRRIGFCLFRSLLFLLLLPLQQQLLPLWGFKLSYHQSVYPYIIPAEAAGGWLFRILI